MLCRMYNFDRVFGDRAVREAVSGQRNWFKQEFQQSGVVAEDVGGSLRGFQGDGGAKAM
ncbi:hypothetical protein FOQG_07080 [Fusarium oxysporum f. sp. raphani 54005]|uniref:Uncharacterized protein n=5 Tax=Fusarium oxysporum TaxID=5507 RepID=X0C801_FUSOX|nr:hypothetical protein FOVG_11946 [Fusarium oxysporum f. sp. pisi HDV247]EXK90236.1 hypothetical protein FOQG_07080 [Fusarium oxysporum f. sp. raphani 54005]EXL81803.1 hypothetical protein FOPG_05126 [Fusarium oxysporum f. sp. conglutinans race 2 54008]EXM27180.1 hypothetical protein FOTG_06550 [Fusarium oxysporum f. sp. vasinfectum 25433]KAI8407070.1 hypothetical protein FOFC_12504 [Fusarium oxysporum]KAK2670872.1 hypothetical protein RAB80_013294 [Fusarium oxysporum f. sp. vasinfectum]